MGEKGGEGGGVVARIKGDRKNGRIYMIKCSS